MHMHLQLTSECANTGTNTQPVIGSKFHKKKLDNVELTSLLSRRLSHCRNSEVIWSRCGQLTATAAVIWSRCGQLTATAAVIWLG